VTRYDKDVLSRAFRKHGYKLAKYSTFNTFSYLFPGKYLSEFACKQELKYKLPFGNLLLCVFEI